jgi:hypothetical protein
MIFQQIKCISEHLEISIRQFSSNQDELAVESEHKWKYDDFN